jgi:thiosulfate/3-mercaptopyruvate sulfurtransferase
MADTTTLDGPLVDAPWLREHLDSVRVVDVRWYLDGRSGLDAYFSGHIPGAVWADIDHDLSGPGGPGIGRHPLPTPERFASAMASLGIGNDDIVVAYDDASDSIAARLWWMLDAIGVRAAVLDGGLASWTYGLSHEPATPHMARFTPRAWPESRVVDADEVDDLRQHGLVLDARAFERFTGDDPGMDARPGHIPGSHNAPWAGNVDPVSGRFLPAEALRQRYAALGVEEGERVVVSCGSGVTACHDLLALRLAGFGDAALYAGSWSGWSSDPDRPAALGSDT